MGSIITAFLVYTTMAFNPNKSDGNTTKDTETLINFSKVIQAKDATLEYQKDASTIASSAIGFADFWRLSSAFFMPAIGKDSIQSSNEIKKNGKVITVWSVRGIFSWYDPFKNYTLKNTDNTFRIDQITNGSLYYGTESDGTITFYSVDMVANLTYIADGQDMTTMIVFPGMYVRFDPKINKTLKWSDLFRIMLALKSADEKNPTGIEFVDPRMNTTNGKNIFFMYRLPNETKILFEYLHTFFDTKVKTLDILKQYAKTGTSWFTGSPSESIIKNPTKNTYRLLGEMQMIFSQAVNNQITSDVFKTKILDIIATAKNFWLETKASDLLEKFLIDWRFALFLNEWDKGSQYQVLYDQAASILGIVPQDGKWKLFQLLSNIFSKNLIGAKADNSTALNTATVLQNTLSQWEKNGIETKDYFDISLYSFLILQKMVVWNEATNQNIIQRSELEGKTLYQIYITIFSATQKYVDGIKDETLKLNAQKSLVSDFYNDMLSWLVNSLYGTYAEDVGGKINLKSAFIYRGDPKLSDKNHDEIVNLLTTTYQTASQIYKWKIIGIYGTWDATSKNILEKNLVELEGFIALVGNKDYRQYQNSPYASDPVTHLPNYNPQKKVLERYESSLPNNTSQTSAPETTTSQNAEDITRTTKIFTQLAGLSAANAVTLTNTSGTLYNVRFAVNQNLVQAVYDSSKMSISNIVILKWNQKITINDPLTFPQFRGVIASIGAYQMRLQLIMQQNPWILGNDAVIFIEKNQIQIQWKIFSLTN